MNGEYYEIHMGLIWTQHFGGTNGVVWAPSEYKLDIAREQGQTFYLYGISKK